MRLTIPSSVLFALLVPTLGAALVLWRDMAVVQAQIAAIQAEQRYFHGPEPMPK